MTELPLNYLKELATQLTFISVFLGGFSATILATLILAKNDSHILKKLIIGASLSAISFIVAVFEMTQIIMKTLPENPFPLNPEDLILPRLIGTSAFYVGFIALIFVVSISGWLQSKKLGITTSIIGIVGLIIAIMSSIS